MSWKPEVIADGSGAWCGNGLRFATKEEAESQVYDLEMATSTRWILMPSMNLAINSYGPWKAALSPIFRLD